MSIERYEMLPPEVGESRRNYCLRLEESGHEEMFIRKALAYHFNMENLEFPSFFNEFERARLRHLTMLRQLAPKRSRYSMVQKVAKNLGISEELAERWVARHEEVGGLSYIGDEDPSSR